MSPLCFIMYILFLAYAETSSLVDLQSKSTNIVPLWTGIIQKITKVNFIGVESVTNQQKYISKHQNKWCSIPSYLFFGLIFYIYTYMLRNCILQVAVTFSNTSNFESLNLIMN